MDIITQLGELAVGSRLRRLSDYIMLEGQDIYKTFRIDFDPRHFPVFYTLARKGQMSIMEIAEELQMVHPSLIKIARKLEKRGLIKSSPDPKDRRKRFLSLSKKGLELLPELELAWIDISGCLGEMFREQKDNLLSAISDTEKSFETKGFYQRAKSFREKRLLEEVEIIDYHPDLAEDFKQINYDWIQKYFKVEQLDIEALENHKSKILDKGGDILFARYEGKIAGTVALINLGNGIYELAKMGVRDEFQGKQIGKKLGLAVIERAKANGGNLLFLESNRSLTPAINLYLKLGFEEVFGMSEGSDYERADIRMEMKIK